jgi:amidohydrolase
MDVISQVKLLVTDAIGFRRHLHQHPELSFKEVQTQAYIKSTLSRYGMDEYYVPSDQGLVYNIGSYPSTHTPCLLIRADMDALPIQELTSIPYKSVFPKIMHACGHDIHMTVVAFTAIIMKQLQTQWNGSLKVIFQPGEEVLPGGASLMINEGVLQNPKVDHALALHVLPGLEAGKVGFLKGPYMASSDELHVSVKGRGGHAALCNQLNNPVLASSDFIVQLHNRFNPTQLEIPTVVSIGKVIAEGATNVIPDTVQLKGTIRTRDEKWRTKVHHIINELAAAVALQYDIEIKIEIIKGYPSLVNDIAFTQQNEHVAQHLLGAENVIQLEPRMTAEDFAYFTQQVPSCFFRIGTGFSNQHNAEVHSPYFEVNETSIETGIRTLTSLCLNYFNHNSF